MHPHAQGPALILRWMTIASWNNATAVVRVSAGLPALRPLESSSRSMPMACTAHGRHRKATAALQRSARASLLYGHAGPYVQWVGTNRIVASDVSTRAFYVAGRVLSNSRGLIGWYKPPVSTNGPTAPTLTSD